MTQEDKELLLKDLCARFPYGIKASYYGAEEECETWDEIECITFDGYVEIGQYSLPIEGIKPYLFPLSSMTEEQKESSPFEPSLLNAFINGYISLFEDEELNIDDLNRLYDWLNKSHFDYRGLIEKGLAIDATNLIKSNVIDIGRIEQ